MQVDYVLILAAGKGTRMGSIGEVIPKVLWPVFNKSILELEVLYSKKYCKKKTFINLYNYAEKIQKYSTESEVLKNVELIVEEETLDIGGAIHNLAAKLNYSGKLLVLNSDQFIMLNEDIWSEFYQLSESKDVVLLTYDVKGKDLYNGTIVKNQKLVEIRKNDKFSRDETHETYTGMSIINLERLEKRSGMSKFFDSVADYKKLNVGALNIKTSNYWDFGTIRRYYNSCFEILKKWNTNEPFISFLKENRVLDDEKVTSNSYASNYDFVIDLGDNSHHISKTIYIGKSEGKVPEQDCIVLDKLREIVDLPSL